MKTEQPLSEHPQAGDGVERTATQARGAAPRGLTKMLVISTVLAVVAIAVVWLVSGLPRHRHLQSGPASPAAATATTQPTTLRSQARDQAGMGPGGLEKCRAFRQVLRHATELQGAGGGTISPSATTPLAAELAAAKRMPPASLTAAQCGVPLG